MRHGLKTEHGGGGLKGAGGGGGPAGGSGMAGGGCRGGEGGGGGGVGGGGDGGGINSMVTRAVVIEPSVGAKSTDGAAFLCATAALATPRASEKVAMGSYLEVKAARSSSVWQSSALPADETAVLELSV